MDNGPGATMARMLTMNRNPSAIDPSITAMAGGDLVSRQLSPGGMMDWSSLLSKWASKVRGRFFSTTIACPACVNVITASVIKGMEHLKADRTVTILAFCSCCGSFRAVFKLDATEERYKP